jgi:hypothetical protein
MLSSFPPYMGKSARDPSRAVWALARNQHGLVTRPQLLERGVGSRAIESRLTRGRLHRIHRGVYAVGRPELTPKGWWMAAVLACGPAAVLSHRSAAELWGIRRSRNASTGEAQLRPTSVIDVSIPGTTTRRRRGIRTHRCRGLPQRDQTRRDRIPVTTPARTLIDLATQLDAIALEAAVNEADGLGRIDPETLRAALDQRSGLNGVPALRKLLDRRTFALTDSELERRFLRLVGSAGLPKPLTQQHLNGFSRRLLLARAAVGRRGGQPSVPPHTFATDERPSAGSSPHGRRVDVAQIHARTNRVRREPGC